MASLVTFTPAIVPEAMADADCGVPNIPSQAVRFDLECGLTS
jgi:hypothetical protein